MEGFKFKPRARLLLQLGDQLIKDGSIALSELIKNSYDAYANNVSILMNNITEQEKYRTLFEEEEEPEIIIDDDGIGMDIEIIKNVWLEPGSDYKEKIYIQKKNEKKFIRLPLGEKGIGRFGVHKLGNKIELISKMSNSKEVVVKINWNDFTNDRYLEDVLINIEEREPEIFTNGLTGTKIIIKDLKTIWTKEKISDVYRNLSSLITPFETNDKFSFTFKINNKNWLDDLIDFNDIKKYSLFQFECKVNGMEIIEFKYEFTPWEIFSSKINASIVTEKDEYLIKNKKLKMNNEEINLSKYKIGEITLKGLIFDRDANILKLGIGKNKNDFKKYLDENGGFRVYRDGIRIFNYGEKGDDWLNLNLNRVNMPSVKLSNNIILAMVNINRKDSDDLIEKTNREGFIENDAFKIFVKTVLFVINKVETLRNIDKTKLKAVLGLYPTSREGENTIEAVKKIINNDISDKTIQDNLNKYIKRIEISYNFLKETLIKTSSIGLSLSIVIHELEKSVQMLDDAVKANKEPKIIEFLVEKLSFIIESYTKILKKGDLKKDTLKKIIEEPICIMELKMKRHNFKIDIDYNGLEYKKINCPKNYVETMLVNIIDNSISWFQYANTIERKILIKISTEIKGYISIIISDTGPGFSILGEDAIKPFISTKPDGMGLGLHIISLIMENYDGKIIIDEAPHLVNIDEFYKNGATVILAFKEQEEN